VRGSVSYTADGASKNKSRNKPVVITYAKVKVVSY
jgi:hypothetical protein